MSENNTIRLMKAAREFNVGKTTILEFLSKSGFSVDNKPDPVLTAEMYHALIAEYDAERAAKKKSDNVILAKTMAEEKKAKEAKEVKEVKKEEIVSLKKEEAVKVDIVGKIDLAPKPKSVKKVEVEPVTEEKKPVKSTKANKEQKEPETEEEA
ncbi:MAG TPA: hypothetical protein DCF44_01050, partial [Chitinophagaceae bacterium]|nr:hypothetical protein [Chitinophagaceae bacterium]